MKVFIANIYTAQGKWVFDAVLLNGKKVTSKRHNKLVDMVIELQATLEPYDNEESEIPKLDSTH